MTDIVIPLCDTPSKWQDNEIHYALRSIEKYLTGYRDIYIVGKPRAWLQNVKYIDAEDVQGSGRRQFSIFRKTLAAAVHDDISDPFISWHDDIFLLKPLDVKEIKYWKNGTLRHKGVLSSGVYQRVVLNTRKRLIENGHPEDCYDMHTPIPYEKMKFAQLADEDWSNDLIIKSLYCNKNGVKGEEMKHLKFLDPLKKEQIEKAIEGRLFFSLYDSAINESMKGVLQELYSEPSKYEKTCGIVEIRGAYVVGERGPEIFAPRASVVIIPSKNIPNDKSD